MMLLVAEVLHMRYAKGTVVLSPTRDIPLLLEMRNYRFISHQQLFDLISLSGSESSGDNFYWRVKRLLAAGYISVCPGNFARNCDVYRITTSGLDQLENHGHFAATLNSKTQHLPHPSEVHHALELNSIRLALARSGALAHWQSDVETASFNTVSRASLAKDYDAVVDVWNGQELA